MFAQLRYTGPADTLWRLSGSEVFDLSGPIAIGADISGRLVSPTTRGSLRAQNARIESAVTGMVIDQLAAEARFSGPQLIFSRLAGRTSGGGCDRRLGHGHLLVRAARLLDLNFNASQALLLDRDDIAARVTGPLTDPIERRRAARSPATCGSTRAASCSAGPAPPRRFRSSRCGIAASIPKRSSRSRSSARGGSISSLPATISTCAGSGSAAAGEPTSTSAGPPMRRASPAAPTWCAAIMTSPAAASGSSAGSSASRAKARPTPCSTSTPRRRSRASTPRVRVTGTGLKPEITFASVPALPQDELLSRILFGTSITNLSAPEALQLASAVAALNSGSGSLDPINAVRRAVGLDRLRIVPADVATGQKTSISAGKYIGRKLFVEVITDGQGYSATRVEYQMTRWLSLLSSVSTIGRTSANVRVSKDY